MYLTTFDPFARNLQRQFDRLTSSAVMPLDGIRRDGDVLLRFDVPGIDPEADAQPELAS
jgi:HSP20 family protein